VGKHTEIIWTESTFNTHWGCTKISEGCAHCYAETFSKRVGFSDTGSQFRIWGDDAQRRFFGDAHWQEPLKWNAAADKLGVMHRVFCGSMCDILEDRLDLLVPRSRVFQMVPKTPNLLWLFLSKRPENAAELLPYEWAKHWPRNVMAGFTIENQKRLEERLPHIARLHKLFPGIQTFASCEPLLSALDWNYCGLSRLRYFDWIIAGGESGPGARPMHPDWIRKLRDDCAQRDDMCLPWPVPFLFKQWGDYRYLVRMGKTKAGRTLDGRTWDQVPLLTHGPQIQADAPASTRKKQRDNSNLTQAMTRSRDAERSKLTKEGGS
jgi:protein gp37